LEAEAAQLVPQQKLLVFDRQAVGLGGQLPGGILVFHERISFGLWAQTAQF
jgi:hypothetical protein